jgi:hypothetical protein
MSEILSNARQAIEREEAERGRGDRVASRRLWKALMLANDLETLDALLAGDKVPVDRLDRDWLERFGRRAP